MILFTKYLEEIKNEISKDKQLKDFINKKDLNNINLEKPPENFDFDLSSNIALVIGKTNKTNPLQIAERIKDILSNEIDDFSSVEIAGPGFFTIVNQSTGKESYTRNGQFSYDKEGFLSTLRGGRVQALKVDRITSESKGIPGALKVLGLN